MRKTVAGLAALAALGAGAAQAGQVVVPGKAPAAVGAADAVVLVDPVSGAAVTPVSGLDAVQPDISITANGQSTVIDAGASGGVVLAVSGTFVATINAQWSNKAAGPWTAGVCTTSANSGGSFLSTTINSTGQYVCPKFGRYVNVTSTAYTSGTATVTPALLAQRPAYPSGLASPATAADAGTLTNALRSESITKVYNGATEDLARSVSNGLNSTGTGLLAAAAIAQCDDTTPQALTENSWGAARLGCADHAQLAGGLNASGQVKGLLVDSQGLLVKNAFQGQATYTAAGRVGLAASATDAFVLTGSASKTIYVTRLRIAGVQTSGGLVDVFVQKHSTADTGGTCSPISAVPHSSANAAASATYVKCTANPTVGTVIGNVRYDAIPFGASTSTVPAAIEYQFAAEGQPIVLSGTSQELAVNLGGVTVTGGNIYVTVEWIEF